MASLKKIIQGSFNLWHGVRLYTSMIDRAASKEPVQAGLYTAVWGIWDGRMQQEIGCFGRTWLVGDITSGCIIYMDLTVHYWFMSCHIMCNTGNVGG